MSFLKGSNEKVRMCACAMVLSPLKVLWMNERRKLTYTVLLVIGIELLHASAWVGRLSLSFTLYSLLRCMVILHRYTDRWDDAVICSVKLWSMPELFRSVLLTMGRYTNPASFFLFYSRGLNRSRGWAPSGPLASTTGCDFAVATTWSCRRNDGTSRQQRRRTRRRRIIPS